MWLTELDSTYLQIGQYFDMAIIVLPIIIILWAIRQENSVYQISISQRIVIAIFVGALAYSIYDPFLYLYHRYINPDWFAPVLSLKESELRASNISPNEITDTIQKMKDSNAAQSGIFRLSTIIPSVFVMPTFIALISLIFIRGNVEK